MAVRWTAALAVAGLAALALGAGADDAWARGGGRAEARRLELTRPAGGVDDDASGEVRVRQLANGERAIVEVRNLDPRTRYEVRDPDTDRVLGILRTNRRGRGTLKIDDSRRGKRAQLDGVARVQVLDGETGEPVLEGDLPDNGDNGSADDGSGDEFLIGFDTYENDEGDLATATMGAFGADSFFDFTFLPAPDANDRGWMSIYSYTVDTAAGDELPVGADSAQDLVGRAFELRDADGNVVVAGDLPELESIAPWDPGEEPGIAYPEGNGVPAKRGPAASAEAPEAGEGANGSGYFLWIENDEGDLEECGELEGYDDPWIEPPPSDDPGCCCACCCCCWCMCGDDGGWDEEPWNEEPREEEPWGEEPSEDDWGWDWYFDPNAAFGNH